MKKSITILLSILLACTMLTSCGKVTNGIIERVKAIFIFRSIRNLDIHKTANDSKNLDSLLVKSANEFSKNLPMMIDSETRLDAVIAYSKTLLSVYTIVNFSRDEIDTNELKNNAYPQLLNGIKTISDLKMFRDNKVTWVYLYRDKDGKEIIKFRFEYEDYREDKPMLDAMEYRIANYTETLRIKPDDYEILNLRGNAYAQKDNYDRAIKDFEAMLKIDPNNIDARNGLEKILKWKYEN